jgi:hypothetical protein
VAQPVQCLTTDWATGVRSPAEVRDYSSSLCVQTSSEAHSASYPVGTGRPFPSYCDVTQVRSLRSLYLHKHDGLTPMSRVEIETTSQG